MTVPWHRKPTGVPPFEGIPVSPAHVNIADMTTPDLRGFQYTADYLSAISGKTYSRQAVQGLWKRGREGKNTFPDMKEYSINGHLKYYFDMEDIREWYNTSMTSTHGKRYYR